MSGTDDFDGFDDPGVTVAVRDRLSIAVRVPSATLRLADGGAVRMSVDRPLTLGSAEAADVRVQHPTTSRVHARVEMRAGGFWIVDLGSTNGTRVNRVRVGEAMLDDGAQLELGDAKLSFHLDAETTKKSLWPSDRFGALVGRSDAMRALFAQLARVAQSDATVLVHGETGTGKDLVARAIHEASPRADKPLVVFDCGSVTESLFESELFGHAKGAFTGADRSRDGAALAAADGTLFLDEVGELPLSVQPKLLRLLESRTVRRVGETAPRPFEARVIAATHRDLAKLVAEGSFREDLYFRLVVLPITVPPVRERREDIPLSLEHFARGAALEPRVVEEAQGRSWPGNVRELRTFVERAAALGADEALRLASTKSVPRPAARFPEPDLDAPFREQREAWADAFEKAFVEGWLKRTNWNVSAAAEAIGVDRTYVHRLMKRHGLSRT